MLPTLKKEWLNPHEMPATFTVMATHDEAELGAAVFIEAADTFVFSDEGLKYRQRLGNTILRHARKAGDSNDADNIANPDRFPISVNGFVWCHGTAARLGIANGILGQ